MPGTLFVVATPIGNLEDITLRALRILREVAVVAAEDTRRTANLLRHYQITTPLISVHAHNEHRRRTQIVERLLGGDSIALVSDAGTPGISDPGAIVVKAARDAGIRVDPIPGPSAVTAVLSASGLSADKFAFAGFPPARSKDRKHWLQWVQTLPDTPVVCFEAPHRIDRTLAELKALLVNRPIIVARELTKAFEEWTFDHSAGQPRGEFVLIIGPMTNNESMGADCGRKFLTSDPKATTSDPTNASANSKAPTSDPAAAPPDDRVIAEYFGEITKSGRPTSRREAIRTVAERFRLSTRTVYQALERAKN